MAIIAAISLSVVYPTSSVIENTNIAPNESASADSKVKVLASFYPLYEFARNVGGDKAEVGTLIPIGVEPHDWEPTTADLQQLQNTDVFVYNGANFEPWVNRIIESEEFNMFLVDTAEGLTLMESEETHEEHDHAVDPHIWLDPILAKHQVISIKEALTKADPSNADHYEENAGSYISKLDSLDAKIRVELANCKKDTFVSFHKAFGYFAERYGLKEVSLGGLTPEAEASPAELRELVEFAKSTDVKVIYSEELVDPRLAEVLANEVGAQVLSLSPIEGLTNDEIAKGLTYIEKMEQNVQNLKVGLECS